MQIFHTPDEFTHALKKLTHPRVLVPTMGALHEGHLQLVHRAREISGSDGSVILSLFVNPTQFDREEDLVNYPRTLERDLELCREHGVDAVFSPEPTAMYADDHSVTVTENSLSRRLCGATRPGHFDGVCTVVLKLLNITQADAAVFGKKDYQQLAVIRRMVRDLNVPCNIIGVDTVREASGLAMSSRNKRLTKPEYEDAPRIRRAFLSTRELYDAGERDTEKLLDHARSIIEANEVGARIDYLELLDAENLQPIAQVERAAVMAAAVFYGKARLIDNIEIA